MRDIKKILTYQIKRSGISLIILAILGIFNYSSDDFHFLKWQEEIIPSAYSLPCGSITPLEFSVTNPKIIAPGVFPFQLDIVLLNKLLELNIVMDPPSFDPNEQICYNVISKTYVIRTTDGTTPSKTLKLEVKSGNLKADATYSGTSKINLLTDPIIGKIDSNGDGILKSLEDNGNCKTEQNKINCSKGTTKLTIDKNENIFVGESTNPNKPNGIIIIFEKTESNPGNVENRVNVEVCEKEKKSEFWILPNSVIEVDCV